MTNLFQHVFLKCKKTFFSQTEENKQEQPQENKRCIQHFKRLKLADPLNIDIFASINPSKNSNEFLARKQSKCIKTTEARVKNS